MIIVSQDKKTIFNFDNVRTIQIENNIIYSFMKDEGWLYLGKYETEKRAEEVLMELVHAIALKSRTKMTTGFVELDVSDGVYYMPDNG